MKCAGRAGLLARQVSPPRYMRPNGAWFAHCEACGRWLFSSSDGRVRLHEFRRPDEDGFTINDWRQKV